jgi:hypothetical protein
MAQGWKASQRPSNKRGAAPRLPHRLGLTDGACPQSQRVTSISLLSISRGDAM